jgi:16S rRNA processing protein RimM
LSSSSRPNAWISVGRVGRPHGLAGAFVVEEASDAPERLAVGAVVYVDDEAATVVEAKRAGGRTVVRLDRRVARGAALQVRRSELPEPPADSYYVADLVGVPVADELGHDLGIVKAVDPGVANDVLELDGGLRLPLVEDCVLEIDLECRRIVVAASFAEGGAASDGGQGGADSAAGAPL